MAYPNAGTALDWRTNRKVWQKEVPYLASVGSGVLATAGGLLFHGGSDGYFRAFDSQTGEELWRFQTGFGADAAAAAYQIDGEQSWRCSLSLIQGGKTRVARPNLDWKPILP